MSLAGRHDGAGQRFDLERPLREAIEIHRGAGVGRIGQQRRQHLLGLICGKPRAVGAADCCGLFEDGKAERFDIFTSEHRLPLQRKRRDRVGNGIDEQFSPGERVEIGAAKDRQRRAIEQLREGPPI